MSLTKFPKGILATPNLPGAAGIPPTTGKIFFVDSNAPKRNTGDAPENAMKTIDAAYNLCRASKGDQIWVMPGHAETIASATSLVMDKAGISIYGLGEGRNRPVLTFSATASQIDVTGANNKVSNIVFDAGISAVVAAFDVDATATDFVLDGCEFNFSTTAYDFVIMVDLTAAVRPVMRNCKFIAEETAGSNNAILLSTTISPQIEGNWFSGDFTQAMIYNNTGVSTGLVIADNTGYNSDTTLGASVDINVASTGIISGNRFATAYVAGVDATFDPGSCGCVENYVSWVGDYQQFPVPFGLIEGWYMAKKSITFYGGSGTAALAIGTVGTYGYFTIAGTIEANMVGIVGTNLAGALATISVGVTGDTDALLGISTGTDLDANEVWIATAGLASSAPWTDLVHRPVVICGAASPSIFHTVATADVSGGQCDFHLYWRPLEPNAYARAK